MVKKSVGRSKFHHVVDADDHDEDHYDDEEEHDDQDDENDQNDEEHDDNHNENDDYNANCQIPVRPLNFRMIKIVNDTKQCFAKTSMQFH